jgi:hypothetical protein
MQDVQLAKEEHGLCGRCEAIMSFNLCSLAYLGRNRRLEDDNTDEPQTHYCYVETFLATCVGENSISDSISSLSTIHES